jgi:hypothetical protein
MQNKFWNILNLKNMFSKNTLTFLYQTNFSHAWLPIGWHTSPWVLKFTPATPLLSLVWLAFVGAFVTKLMRVGLVLCVLMSEHPHSACCINQTHLFFSIHEKC